MNDRQKFYRRVLTELIKDKNASILVCGAGPMDKDVHESSGYTDVTISNLDSRMTGNEYAPFKWVYQNAESLTYPDGSFDYAVIHAAVHHASSPHRVLTEMYRVARKGVLVFESRDSFIMRFLERYELTQSYEHAAVYYNDCKYGGCNNTAIPNYVYRWTEREIEKTIQSYSPQYRHKFIYRYGTAFPCTPELENKAHLKTLFLKACKPFFLAFKLLFPKQQNMFGFFIEKPASQDALWPWLKYDPETKLVDFDKAWGDRRYKNSETFTSPRT